MFCTTKRKAAGTVWAQQGILVEHFPTRGLRQIECGVDGNAVFADLEVEVRAG